MNIREESIKVLDEVINNKAFSNIVLDKALSNDNISQVDKNFITMLVHGVLQNYYLLDYKIKKLNSKKIKRKVYLILLISIYQLDYMTKIPEYAVINEATSLTKKVEDNYASKFVNALLRNYVSNKIEINENDFNNVSEYLSVKYSTPEFIIKMLIKQYDLETTKKILDYTIKNAPLNVRVNSFKTSKEELLKHNEYKEGSISKYGLIYKGSNRNLLNEHVKKGLVSIQDEAGQLIAPLLDLKETDYVLDMTAAPGSKTCHMGELLKNKGKIVAVDLYEHRLELLNKAKNRLGLTNIITKAYDSTKLSEVYNKESFDKILLDAPCSGLGVIRRKMDIKYNVSPESIDELVSLQKTLLEEAYSLLKENGTLVYSTCTINKKENEKQIENFIKNHSDLEVVTQKTLLPYEYDTDGFYYCKIIKKGVK